MRPIILNGIEDVVERPDLADRSLFLNLETIPKEKRRAEEEIFKGFASVQPGILGVLLDTIAMGLKRYPEAHLSELPRMADFAKWISACEEALWKKGTFIEAYTVNIDEAVETVIEGDLVATTVIEFMKDNRFFEGTATALHEKLAGVVGETLARNKAAWPQTPRALSGSIKRLAPSLRKAGITIQKFKHGRRRYLRLEYRLSD
jgi:hypothetical protein